MLVTSIGHAGLALLGLVVPEATRLQMIDLAGSYSLCCSQIWHLLAAVLEFFGGTWRNDGQSTLEVIVKRSGYVSWRSFSLHLFHLEQ